MATRQQRRASLFLVLLLLLLPAGAAWAEESAAPPAEPEFTPPENLHEGWYARIETTKGRILIRLLPEQAPQSVAHFTALADGRMEWADLVTGEIHKGPYYDGVAIHKCKAGQRFETGDRSGTGRGAPLIYVPPDEGHGPVNFSAGGRVGMTRSAGGKISAVQFFVTASGQPFLNRKHPCFGVVIEGHNNVFNISQVKVYSSGRPIKPITVEKVRVFKVGDPAPLPEPEHYEPVPLKFGRREKTAETP